jgi:hypothetical protein
LSSTLPIKSLMERLNLSRYQVRTRHKRAIEEGLLIVPHTPGRAGGELTPKARAS